MLHKNVICPICKSNSWKETFHGNGYILQTSPCGLTKTRVVDKNQNYPTDALYEDSSEVKKHYQNQKEGFEQYAQSILNFIPVKSGTLLDVGAGFGWVVNEAKKRGFDSQGIDQSKTYAAFGKKTLQIDLKNVSLQEFKSKEKFDIVVLNHVLEHIAEPVSFLKKINGLLKTDGLLFVACPNIDSLMFTLFKSRWYGLQPYQHIWQFTPDSLERLIESNGFKTDKLQTTNLDYKVSGAKGFVFSLITTLAPFFRLGDQTFIVVRKSG